MIGKNFNEHLREFGEEIQQQNYKMMENSE